jgi:hypothetical protein
MVPVDPTQWADPSGAMLFYVITAVILIGSALKLFGTRWDDWLDERWGRGSVRDEWLLWRIERDARLHRR